MTLKTAVQRQNRTDHKEVSPSDQSIGCERDILLRKLTRREFRERMASGELKACIITVGAVEQHLEHLAMDHDWRSSVHIALAVAGRMRPHVLVVDGLMAGVSEKHMQHAGTLSLRPGTFLAVLGDLIESVSRAGFRHVLVLNGHGSNAPVTGFWEPLQQLNRINLQFLTYWDLLTQDDANELLKSRRLPGHAQEFETAFAMAAFPENVRNAVLSDQADPTPSLATPEQGRELVERVVDRVALFLQEMIDGKRAAENLT